MSIIEVKTYQFKCDRCGHIWFPRTPVTEMGELELPKTCPHCKSPYWNAPRKNKRPAQAIETAEKRRRDSDGKLSMLLL